MSEVELAEREMSNLIDFYADYLDAFLAFTADSPTLKAVQAVLSQAIIRHKAIKDEQKS